MKIPQLVLLVFFTVAVARGAEAQQTLTLVNGDRLTGRVASVSDGVWTIEYLGATIEIPAAEIASFSAPAEVGVRLDDGSIFAATVEPDGSDVSLRGVDGQTQSIPLSRIAAIGDPLDLDALAPLEIGLFSPLGKFWTATIGAGFSDKSGKQSIPGAFRGFVTHPDYRSGPHHISGWRRTRGVASGRWCV